MTVSTKPALRLGGIGWRVGPFGFRISSQDEHPDRARLESMQITLEIPDEFAANLAVRGENPARAALEAIGIEAYRQRRLNGYQLRMLLGIPSRYEFDALLKEHKVEKYTAEDFEQDLATVQRVVENRKTDRPA